MDALGSTHLPSAEQPPEAQLLEGLEHTQLTLPLVEAREVRVCLIEVEGDAMGREGEEVLGVGVSKGYHLQRIGVVL